LGAETDVIDITDIAQIQAALATQPRIDSVIHSAGIIYTGLVSDIPIEKQQRLIEVNLIGALNVAYAALPCLKASRGSLVLMASTSAFYGPPEFAIYGATKAGVLGMAQALRLELEPDGVHVGVVCPFFVDTPMIREGEKTRLYGRFGTAHTPDEVAQAIVTGIQKRKFMIWPSRNPAFFHWLSHYGYPLSHVMMRWFWR
jgi:short-subunit dehydrogenase